MVGSIIRSLLMLVTHLALEPSAKDDPPRRYEFAEKHMGSTFTIILYSDDEPTARRASRAAFNRIAALDASFSDYQPGSELMRLCEKAGGPPVPVSADLFTILQHSKSMYERSEGAFDVTIGPLVRLWRRARRDKKLPSTESLDRARSLVSSGFMILDPKARTIALTKPGMKLDLGGIAKGYASDAAVKVLRGEGIARCLVAGSGDVVAAEPPPGQEGWTVGIGPLEAPLSAPERVLLIKNMAVSTAGDTEQFVEIEGKRYSHIVDARTGLGKIDRASVTVVARNGMTADALDTAVYAMGPERGLPLVEKTEGASAYIVRTTESGKQVHESRRFRELPRASKEKAVSPERILPAR